MNLAHPKTQIIKNLNKYFGKFGKVQHISVKKDIAYIKYSSQAFFQSAIKERFHFFEGDIIEVAGPVLSPHRRFIRQTKQLPT